MTWWTKGFILVAAAGCAVGAIAQSADKPQARKKSASKATVQRKRVAKTGQVTVRITPRAVPGSTLSGPAAPQFHNQFITVNEFVLAGRTPKTPVSVEGYIVLDVPKPSGSQFLYITDSVDKVLNADDANKAVKRAALMVLPTPLVKANYRFTWNAKNMQKLAMFTGRDQAEKQLNDVIAKVRITGIVGKYPGIVEPVHQVEMMDDNGDWKKL